MTLLTTASPLQTALRQRRVRLITRDNGAGLSRDIDLVARTLQANQVPVSQMRYGATRLLNHAAELAAWLQGKLHGRVDTQVFIERVYRRCLPLGERNLLIPNPEWTQDKWLPLLRHFDEVLVKTRHAERVFRQLGCATRYIGFTSEDRLDPGVPRASTFLHMAGRSSAKGTATLLRAWKRHPEWPRLTVLQFGRNTNTDAVAANIEYRIGYLSDSELRQLQNSHRFHICPSEVEGFGHYLMEAMSVGAVVLATDGEPMNELVTPERGVLIAAGESRPMALGTRYLVDVAAIEDAVEHALALTAQQCQRIGDAGRSFFLDNDQAFAQRLLPALLPQDSDVLAEAGLCTDASSPLR